MNNNLMKILIGVGISIGFTLLLLFIFSILLAYTSISETAIPPVVIIITGISILIGSSIITSKIKKRGIVNGTIVGGIYILTIYLISSILNTGFDMNIYTIGMLIVGVICGAIGGIVGVNVK